MINKVTNNNLDATIATAELPSMQRRSALKKAATVAFGLAAGAMGSPALAAMEKQSKERVLSFYNIHTRERLQTVYWKDGSYLEDPMLSISHHLRDHRENETMMIDPALMDILWAVREQLGGDIRFDVISGYRTPKTNAMLRKRSSKVAKFSLHMVGQAVDLTVSNRKVSDIRDAGLKVASGGVGYYPKSGFVHLDSGEFRHW